MFCLCIPCAPAKQDFISVVFFCFRPNSVPKTLIRSNSTHSDFLFLLGVTQHDATRRQADLVHTSVRRGTSRATGRVGQARSFVFIMRALFHSPSLIMLMPGVAGRGGAGRGGAWPSCFAARTSPSSHWQWRVGVGCRVAPLAFSCTSTNLLCEALRGCFYPDNCPAQVGWFVVHRKKHEFRIWG